MIQRAVDRLRPFRAVIFDLDGTLVRLEVDWQAAQRAVARLAARGFGEDRADRTIWEMLRGARGREREALGQALGAFELEGGRRARRLPLAGVLPHLADRRVGVVTLNSRASCEEALRVTGLEGYVHAKVAREDARRLKPDPAPLLLCINLLEARPEESVFVGDRERDRETAQRANTAFLAAPDLLG